ncbi:MAG: sigma-70 family RNA polymerase sigma factor [Planctomycetota bacterium]|nr:MAG: sigma-70 family RNA polymerase sigma factor [Planctomycetota bacterium]
MDPTSEITRLLIAGDEKEAAEALLPLVYEELKGMAHVQVARLGKGKTLSTTDVVHESWIRLVGRGDPGWEGRRHFFGAAAQAMRNVLVDAARRRQSLKRDASRNRELDAELAELVTDPPLDDVLSVDEALTKLEEQHARCAQIVSLRFFAGLSMPEAAEIAGISLATAERDWRFARAWLQKELGRSEL